MITYQVRLSDGENYWTIEVESPNMVLRGRNVNELLIGDSIVRFENDVQVVAIFKS